MLRKITKEINSMIKQLTTIFDLKIKRVLKEKEEMIGIENKNAMSDREIKELKNRVRAMSPEELAIVAEAIPVELCLARLHNEIDRLHNMELKLGQMISVLDR